MRQLLEELWFVSSITGVSETLRACEDRWAALWGCALTVSSSARPKLLHEELEKVNSRLLEHPNSYLPTGYRFG